MKEQAFTIQSKDFNELYNLAEVIIQTRSGLTKEGGKEKNPPEVLAALALQAQIDTAKESGAANLMLTEREVVFLSEVV